MSDRSAVRKPPPFFAATVAAFMSVGVAGCSSGSDEYVHCIDDSGNVVDPSLCEEAEYSYSPGYWYYVSRTRYGVGERVPDDYTTSRIDPSDSTARANAGLSESGGVGGTTVRGGGFGSGSAGDGGGGFGRVGG
jgi:hypothetical protein